MILGRANYALITIDIGYASVNGIPLNKFVSALGRIQGFGNDTFYYNMHDFADIYIRPLFKMIEKTAQNVTAH